MSALAYLAPSLMRAGRYVPGIARAFVPIARTAINAARSRLRPVWEFASRTEARMADRTAQLRREFINSRPGQPSGWWKAPVVAALANTGVAAGFKNMGDRPAKKAVDRSVPDSFMRPWKARAIGAPKNFRPRNIGAPKSFQPRNMGRPIQRDNVGSGSQVNSGRKKIIAKTFYERDA